MGGGGGSKVEVQNIQAPHVDMGAIDAAQKASADELAASLNKSSDQLKSRIEASQATSVPYTQTAMDAMNEMALSSGVKVKSKSDTLTADQLLGRIQGFQDLMDKANPDGSVQLNNQQIADRYRQAPEYGAAYGAGLDAMNRSQAASGLVNSGRALTEAQQFGQGMMDLSIQSHIDRMQKIAGLTVPVALQAAAQALPNAQAIYNATIAGPTNKAKLLNNLAQLDQGATQFNINNDLQASTANHNAQIQMAKIAASMNHPQNQFSGTAAEGTSINIGSNMSSANQSPLQQQLFQQQLLPTPWVPLSNPYDQGPTRSAMAFTDNGPLGGLFGGLF